ncbi:hypothetical protein BUALT_Bualt15G0053200 [Buddleja alternifolia]|uniref:Phytosulfokine n=1 Tax=Buddleja alternifolia TaxID=168488 RepID=A0AAV6WI34_9LAMI|nr:hypothetical protein BUALT_Bualt15G0053200 [Buddleja alternifolia]
MAKMATLCMTTILLFLSLSHVIARREPAFHDVTPMETHRGDNEVQKEDVNQDSCDGMGEDECMMRKTLEAHLDYIYTQKRKQP